MQKLLYCDMYCFEVCYVMISCIFYAYVVVFSIRAHCAIQYTLFLAINRLVHPSSTPMLLIQPLPHHLYCRMMQQNILCISCVHFISSINIVSMPSLYGQSKPKMWYHSIIVPIVDCCISYLGFSPRIAPCRVVLLPKQICE